ncbi:hypothetical protein Syun_001807 [Stephania yunnanensis]|uniref:Uncharacterized protein n=1 Tax=Stephania yunnanensis TaxID=152371 RepID=A0AAP0LGE2_9MAGN
MDELGKTCGVQTTVNALPQVIHRIIHVATRCGVAKTLQNIKMKTMPTTPITILQQCTKLQNQGQFNYIV